VAAVPPAATKIVVKSAAWAISFRWARFSSMVVAAILKLGRLRAGFFVSTIAKCL
jgi:hypothetical protein